MTPAGQLPLHWGRDAWQSPAPESDPHDTEGQQHEQGNRRRRVKTTTCLVCQRQRGTEIGRYALAADPIAHHHHAVLCQCGAAWFADITRSAFGEVASRRDTLPCTCHPARHRLAVVFVAASEWSCACGADLLDAEVAA